MSRGLGRTQQAIIDAVREPYDIKTLTTTELSQLILGKADHDSIGQIRRAVDSLAKRGLVDTWTGSAVYSDDPQHWRRYARRVRYGYGDWCRPHRVRTSADPEETVTVPCPLCAMGHQPVGTKKYDGEDRPYHDVTLEVKAKSRMRWVCFRFDARPPNERVFMLGRWIEKQQARVDLGPETLLYSFAVEKLAEYTAQRDALLAEMGGRPTPFLL